MAARKTVLKVFIIIILAVFLLSTGLISVLYLGGKGNTTGTGEDLSITTGTTQTTNRFPTGRVSWSGVVDGKSVVKRGPTVSNDSYVVELPASSVSSMPKDQCLGDSEVALCYVGKDPQVLDFFSGYNYFY